MKVEKRGPRKITVLYPLPNTKTQEETEQKKLRVAAYCRVSSGSNEQMHSCEAQIQYYEEYIKGNPDYYFVGIYSDEGISGTNIQKRDAFKRLLQDCRDGRIDMIITKSISRFGRNTLDSLKSIREFKSLAVDVYFEKENIHTLKNEGEMLLTLISAVAQQESMSLSENVKWGIRRKYERGHVQSIPYGKLLGYSKNKDGNLIINEDEAATVQRIYTEFLNGNGCYQIMTKLKAEKIPTACNGEWSASVVLKILKNETYKGDTRCQKTFNMDYISKKRAKNNGDLPQYYYENTHPAIIDKDTWECVQLEFKRQEKYAQDHKIGKYHNHNKEHPLSARIICQTCGCTFMLLKSNRVGEEGRKYWRCSSFRGHKGTEVKDRTFTPPPMALWSNDPDSKAAQYRAKHRKLPVKRQMLCTDIQIPSNAPERAFVKAYNQLLSHRTKCLASIRSIAAKTDDILLKYRADELSYLIETGQKTAEFDYIISLKTLDHIEVTPDGKLSVIFLVGTKITL